MMTEEKTRKEIIYEKLHEAGWDVSDRIMVIEEFDIEAGLPPGVNEPQMP
jgi:type I restriction enzyme R subunit